MVNEKNIRESIVKAGQHVFAKFGFQKTTMNEIARASRKAKSSLYYYFTSKEEIFQAAVEKEARILNEEIKKAVDSEDTPQKKIRSYLLTRMQIIHDLTNFYSAIKDIYLENYDFVESLREKHDDEERATVRRIFVEGIEKEVFFIKDIDITVSAFLIAVKGLEYSWIKENNFSENGKRIENLLDILLYGIIRR